MKWRYIIVVNILKIPQIWGKIRIEKHRIIQTGTKVEGIFFNKIKIITQNISKVEKHIFSESRQDVVGLLEDGSK